MVVDEKEAFFPDLLSFSEICPLLPDSGGCYAVCSRKIADTFGMGQDEGVYQTRAIQLMYGENSRQLDFPEYTQLNMKEREACQDAVVSHLLGFYTVDEYGTIPGYDTETMSRASGIFHGIPNYAAMLALSGRISGIAHMMDIQTVFYILSILLFFMITENLGWKRLTGGILTALPGIFSLSRYGLQNQR